MTSEIPSCKVMWDMETGEEYGIVVSVYESDTDESLIDRAWVLVTTRIDPRLRPKNKSDLRVIHKKKKHGVYTASLREGIDTSFKFTDKRRKKKK